LASKEEGSRWTTRQ
jgi:hypothetical protein